jgi:hypothetical protein
MFGLMEFLEYWGAYLDERAKILLGVAESDLYEGHEDRLNAMIRDLRGRLCSDPMYLQQERRLDEDIKILERVKFFKELNEFYVNRILQG